jgi:hypothetical protein
MPSPRPAVAAPLPAPQGLRADGHGARPDGAATHDGRPAHGRPADGWPAHGRPAAAARRPRARPTAWPARGAAAGAAAHVSAPAVVPRAWLFTPCCCLLHALLCLVPAHARVCSRPIPPRAPVAAAFDPSGRCSPPLFGSAFELFVQAGATGRAWLVPPWPQRRQIMAAIFCCLRSSLVEGSTCGAAGRRRGQGSGGRERTRVDVVITGSMEQQAAARQRVRHVSRQGADGAARGRSQTRGAAPWSRTGRRPRSR